ncbi:hypothetical protein TNIN_165701 [Trichonephila inaurata madagascariensis]|uniref:Uncharacterized protein n=1 Tax=Trichonephila inaurata madagascariensis TaxID=2747483 RepID=A0A8X6WUW9_9ARAC|nr:hypothetical protein TNIN_165701 [Trichonephila inaurata madagascariensis]
MVDAKYTGLPKTSSSNVNFKAVRENFRESLGTSIRLQSEWSPARRVQMDQILDLAGKYGVLIIVLQETRLLGRTTQNITWIDPVEVKVPPHQKFKLQQERLSGAGLELKSLSVVWKKKSS